MSKIHIRLTGNTKVCELCRQRSCPTGTYVPYIGQNLRHTYICKKCLLKAQKGEIAASPTLSGLNFASLPRRAEGFICPLSCPQRSPRDPLCESLGAFKTETGVDYDA